MYTRKRTKVITYISGIRQIVWQKRFLWIFGWTTTGITWTDWSPDPYGDIEKVISVQHFYDGDRVDVWDRLPQD